MSKPSQYRQCTLRKRPSPATCVEYVSFIPSSYANRGAVLKVKQPDGAWDDGWVVAHVGVGLAASDLPDAHRDIRRHRQATGDALPRQ